MSASVTAPGARGRPALGMIIAESSQNPTDRVNQANSRSVQLTGITGVTVLCSWQLRRG